MDRLPQNWRERPGRDPEREAHRLKRRFAAITQRYERRLARATHRRAVRIWAVLFVLVAIVVVGTWVALAALSPWPPMTTLRHIAAAPNCGAARAVGLAPSYRGAPGYYSAHDADRDGIACEPWRVTRGVRR